MSCRSGRCKLSPAPQPRLEPFLRLDGSLQRAQAPAPALELVVEPQRLVQQMAQLGLVLVRLAQGLAQSVDLAAKRLRRAASLLGVLDSLEPLAAGRLELRLPVTQVGTGGQLRRLQSFRARLRRLRPLKRQLALPTPVRWRDCPCYLGNVRDRVNFRVAIRHADHHSECRIASSAPYTGTPGRPNGYQECSATIMIL